jgi:predicted nucleic acid-binding protein
VVADLGRPLYLDASAIVKLVIEESHTLAIRDLVASTARLFTNRIAVVEVSRAVGRQSEVDASNQVSAVLDGLSMVEFDASIAASAAKLEPRGLRSLDAIHLASALLLADELRALVTYDTRLADAARAAGLSVLAPA